MEESDVKHHQDNLDPHPKPPTPEIPQRIGSERRARQLSDPKKL